MATPKKTNETTRKEAPASKKSAPAKPVKKAEVAPAKAVAKAAPKAAPKVAPKAKAPVKKAVLPVPDKKVVKPSRKSKLPLIPVARKVEIVIPAGVLKIIDERKNDKKWMKFVEMQRQHLLDLRDNILDSMAGVTRETLRNHPEGSEASGSGEHQADAGSDAYDRDFALSMLSKEQNALVEIEEALKRIDKSTYGICEISHKSIPILRLEAIPFARLTVECQSQWEKEKGLSAKFVSRNDFGFGGIQNEGETSVSLDEDEE